MSDAPEDVVVTTHNCDYCGAPVTSADVKCGNCGQPNHNGPRELHPTQLPEAPKAE